MKKMLRMMMAMAVLFAFNLDTNAQIRINEVGTNGVDFEGASKWVELYNAGDAEVDISGLILCDFPQYPALSSLTALGGTSTTIPAGGYLVVSWASLDNDDDGDAEVGLYVAGTADFGDSNAVLDYMQYGEAGHFREGTAEGASEWTVGDFVAAAESGMSLQYVDNGTAGSGDWIAAEPTPNAATAVQLSSIRITEIGFDGVDFEGAGIWVELHNNSDADIDVSNLILCDFPRYPTVGSLTALGGGSTTIPAGGFLVVAWPELGDGAAHAEVGLYKEGSAGAFGDSGNVLDYMQFGEANHQREGTAESAGVWTAGEFVALAASGNSLQLVDNTLTGASNWVERPATPNAATAAPLSSIRISEIGFDGVDFEGAGIWVELHNNSDAAIDVTDLILCDFPRYPTVGSLTALGGGSTTIPADGFLVVAWPELGDGAAHAEVGLYKAGSAGAFGDSSNVLDYMQFGEADHRREATAQGAGVWTVGEFVALAASGNSLQLVDNTLTGASNWVERPATPNAANGLSTANEEAEVPANFALHNNFPNPFNPTTNISYDLSTSGHVALDVYDMLGQKVTSLFQGGQAAGSYSFAWDGRDARGNVVSSGVYFYRLTMDGRASASRVMTLLK